MEDLNKKLEFSDKQQKFKIGEYVYYKLDHNEDTFGNKQTIPQNIEDDYTYSHQPRRVIKVLYMNCASCFYYLLQGVNGVIFSEYELKKVPKGEIVIIERITPNRAIHGGKIFLGVKYLYSPTWDYKEDKTIYKDDVMMYTIKPYRQRTIFHLLY